MSAVVFVIYIPTPGQEDLLREADQVPKTIQKVENETENNLNTPVVDLETDDLVKKPLENDAVVDELEANQHELKYTSLQDEPSEDLIDLAIEDNQHMKPHSMKEIVTFLLDEFKIQNVSWNETENKSLQIIFTASGDKCEDLLDELLAAGIGKLYQSNVSMLPCKLHYEPEEDSDSDTLDLDTEDGGEERKSSKSSVKVNEFMKSIKARLTVAQVVEGVKAQAAFTFDFVALILFASMIAAMGLVENSPVVLVASMLISPLMGPILAITFGSVVNDSDLWMEGMLHELIGLGLCIVFGFIFGIICGPFSHQWGNGPWPLSEMSSRGHWRSLWVGSLIALPSGAGVALSVLGGNQGCLVGVAISASLLPPAVNAGMLWGLALVLAIQAHSDPSYMSPPNNYTVVYFDNMAAESATLGVISLTLTLVNIACIIFMGVVVLRIKEVAPGNTSTKRFWKHDIRVTRNYNKTINPKDRKELPQRFLEEWSALSKGKANPRKLEKRLTHIIEGYRNDPTLRNVARYSCYRSPEMTGINNPYLTWHNSTNKTHTQRRNVYQRCLSQIDHKNLSPIIDRSSRPVYDSHKKISWAPSQGVTGYNTQGGELENLFPKSKKSRFVVTKSDEPDV